MRHLRGEQAARLLAILLALGASYVSFELYGTPHAAAGIPLVAAGLGALVAALAALFRIPRLRASLALRLVEAPAAYRAEELARMARARRGLRLAMLGKAALLAAGLVLMAIRPRDPSWYGVGAGLAASGAVLLALAVLAEARARRYVAALERFLDPAAPVSGEADLGE